MADTNDILIAIESLRSDVATKSDLEAIKKDMVTKKDLQEVKQAQVQTNTRVETLAAGQARFDLIEERLNRLEGRAGIDSTNVRCTCAYCVKYPFPWAKPPS